MRAPIRISVLPLALVAACVSQAATAQITAQAVVVDAYDGDTITVEAEIWPDISWSGSVRVRGVDTPEIRGRCATEKALAIVARDFVRGLLIDATVTLSDVEHDLYGGRFLATILLDDGQDLAGLLIANGYGRPYEGGRRQSWCDGLPANPERR